MSITQNTVTETASRIWYAGLGAASKISTQSGEIFEDLVERGRKFEKSKGKELKRDLKQVEARIDKAVDKTEKNLKSAANDVQKASKQAQKKVSAPLARQTNKLDRQLKKAKKAVDNTVVTPVKKTAKTAVKPASAAAIAAQSDVQPLRVRDLPNVSATMADKLERHEITDTAQLLAATGTPVERRSLADSLSVTEDTVLQMAHRADLARVQGIGDAYAELLNKAGVSTVMELARRNPENLLEELRTTNGQYKIAGRLPPQTTLENWISSADGLPRVLEY